MQSTQTTSPRMRTSPGRCLDMGHLDRAIKLAESWVAANPDHEAGRLMRNEIVRRANEVE